MKPRNNLCGGGGGKKKNCEGGKKIMNLGTGRGWNSEKNEKNIVGGS